jgi:hypothetical protein
VASIKQEQFVASLVATRYRSIAQDDYSTKDQVVATVLSRMADLDVRAASVLIDRIKAMPEDPDPDMPAPVAGAARKGVNGSTGKCSTCGHPVLKGEGYYFNHPTEYKVWLTHHKVGGCISAPVPATVAVTEGFYKVGDEIIMVYRTQNNHLAGKVLDGEKFRYQAGAVHSCAAGVRLSSAEAALWGKVHGRCIACRHALKDDTTGKSLDRGYGPVCAAKYGWDWG